MGRNILASGIPGANATTLCFAHDACHMRCGPPVGDIVCYKPTHCSQHVAAGKKRSSPTQLHVNTRAQACVYSSGPPLNAQASVILRLQLMPPIVPRSHSKKATKLK